MNKFDALGDRMKLYEAVSKIYLPRRLPVIIRIDGRSFHSFTRGFIKPFDYVLSKTMQDTMQYLCEHIQGCIFGYTQSDEISLILQNDKKMNTDAWFANNVQKIVSISASMATMIFNKRFSTNAIDEGYKLFNDNQSDTDVEVLEQQAARYKHALDKAMFDSRVFILPKNEVCNYLIWRQNDAIRNSIEMVGRQYFAHNELYGKSCNWIKEQLINQFNFDWEDINTIYKRGSCYIKDFTSECGEWYLDEEIPIFKENRNYIERLYYNS